MTTYNVPKMTCGHCTASITKAIMAIDPTASVSCDLGTHDVDVQSTLSTSAITAAIRDAGYAVNTAAAV